MRKIYLFTFMMLLLVHLKGQAQQITLHVERAGTLHGMINASRLPYITDLKLTGELNGTDISFIRTLVKKNLRFLDLSEARIVEGGAIYYSNYRTSNDIIGSYMFYNPDYSPISPCAISKINLPNSVTGIEEGAFKSCTRLTDINIPNSVTSIGPETFKSCTSLTDINIPNSVTSIGEQAFYNCDNLKSVYMNASTPPFIGSQAFHNISKDLTIYIPRGSYTAYWLSYWGNYNLVEYDPTDIQGVTTSAHNGVEKYFSIDGRPLPGPCKGVNIIQDTDGKTRKAWIP
ncbi:leucine-rich repeat domain-containing protein [Paraprevotella clara]|uniref:leucine-rich repeat domain-containing protein n=1 Tax=Paraprevotella clara TaxID=454154 RepID=UPI00248CECF7|nr:leucine-rich repeat domain-containing protein [Paraprevotella clara]